MIITIITIVIINIIVMPRTRPPTCTPACSARSKTEPSGYAITSHREAMALLIVIMELVVFLLCCSVCFVCFYQYVRILEITQLI